MYKIYLKQAWALIRQERLFSSVYIVGTGLAISLVMVLSIVFYVKMASIYPEMDRDRLLTVKSAALKNEKGGTSSGPVSPRFVEECLAGVPGLEALALCCDDAASAFVQPVGSPVQIPVMKMGVNDGRSSYLENSIESNAQRIVSALGLFLLTNVFLAVIGTFWFHVSRRRAELGLRMAMGSTRASILGLVMGEGLMLLTIATVPALLICVNLAWIDLMPPGLVESKVGCFLINSLLTWLILALIISLATWYPARKASSLEPADALRYDG